MIDKMKRIESACKIARDARQVLQDRAQALQNEITDAQRRKLPGIRSAVAGVAEADAVVLTLLQDAAGLFKKPKSVIFHGLQVGYKKGSGTIEIDDAAQLVKLIRKHFPDQFDVLVKTKETPVKAAIRNLTGAELQRLGVKVQAAGEVVFLADSTAGVDKLVAALLKGVEDEQPEEVEEAA